jgi:hypothetical protein
MWVLRAGDPQNPDKVPTPNKSKVTVAFKKFADRKEPKTSIWLEKVQKEFKREWNCGRCRNFCRAGA